MVFCDSSRDLATIGIEAPVAAACTTLASAGVSPWASMSQEIDTPLELTGSTMKISTAEHRAPKFWLGCGVVDKIKEPVVDRDSHGTYPSTPCVVPARRVGESYTTDRGPGGTMTSPRQVRCARVNRIESTHDTATTERHG